MPPRRKKKSEPWVPLALSSKEQREDFEKSLMQCLMQYPHSEDGPPEENWETLKRCIMETAGESVGRARMKQLDWFSDTTDTLMPLVTAKRRAHCRFLQLQTTAAKRKFRKHQRIVKKAVDEAKEAWISGVIKEAVRARKDGKQRWNNIKKLQMAHRGRKPTRPARLCKRDGGMTSGPDEVKAAWQEHFSRVLNTTSQYQQQIRCLPYPRAWS